jgi:hypothetical protein
VAAGNGRDDGTGGSPPFPRAEAHGAGDAARGAADARDPRRARQALDEKFKQRWVEHPTLLAYITCEEPFQGLKTTPAIAGLRVKLQPKAKRTYDLLVQTLREESGLDLERRSPRRSGGPTIGWRSGRWERMVETGKVRSVS